jgi:uncharacterized protein (DUF302 family)
VSAELRITVVSLCVAESVTALQASLNRRGIELFAVIDHAKGARDAGFQLDDEVVVIFGNPAVGTRLMQDSPVVGLDLPLRLLIWQEGEATQVAYSDPHTLADRFALTNSDSVLDGMATLLAALVDELQAIDGSVRRS